MTDILLVASGVPLLYLGGEALVRGAKQLAQKWGLPPLAIGLTVVALGTSSPELFTSLLAVLQGNTDVATGNVIGSNITNIGLILGVAALIAPIHTHAAFIRREVPFMLGAVLLLLVLAGAGEISRWSGAGLLALIPLYLIVLLRGQEEKDVEEEFDREYAGSGDTRPYLPWLMLAAGLLLLVGGAQILVSGATGLARNLGVSELTISLSLVAFGTSLPELSASVVAALRNEPDIALGNVVGSNVLNILLVLGASAVVRPLPLAPGGGYIWHLVFMLGFSVLLVPFLISGFRLGRREALLLLAGYGAYVAYIFT